MKKILLISFLSLSVAFGNNYYDTNHKSFKDGFEAGLQALSFQAKTDGYASKLIKMPYNFIAVYETKEMPLHEALFLQIIANKEGFETHLSRDFISFGGFDREIDAKDALETIVKKFKLNKKQAKIYRNTKEFVTYPFLWQDFHTNLINEAIQRGVIIETQIIEKAPRVISKTKTTASKPKEQPKKDSTFILRNHKAMGYQNIGDTKDSRDFLESGLKDSKSYVLESKITTRNNENFVKVKGENLYFSIEDIREEK